MLYFYEIITEIKCVLNAGRYTWQHPFLAVELALFPEFPFYSLLHITPGISGKMHA